MPYPGVENYTRYAMARLGLLPLPLNVKSLNPEFGPVVNDFLSFRYRFSVPPCQSVSANRSIFIAVNSAPGNFEKRKVIRQKWRKHLPIVQAQMGLSGFAFVLGLTDDNVTQLKIDEENETNGDIIQIEVSDFYRNLSFKAAGRKEKGAWHDSLCPLSPPAIAQCHILCCPVNAHQCIGPSVFLSLCRSVPGNAILSRQ